MTTKQEMAVALVAAAAGFAALGLFWLTARPEMTNTTVAIATLVYAAAYVLTVPRVEQRVAPTTPIAGATTSRV